MNVADIAARYPRLYHMAEADTWNSIRELGLLSTSGVLDRLGLTGAERERYELRHRPAKMTVPGGKLGSFVLRDQKPMQPGRLARALGTATSPEAWYRLLNAKVYFWVSEERLHGLLCARDYRELEHDVLVVDTASLLAVHAERVWLCHMNSGSTFRYPTPRGPDIFRRISHYPARRNGAPMKEVVELVLDYHVPDIADYVIDVRKMRGRQVLRHLALKQGVREADASQ